MCKGDNPCKYLPTQPRRDWMCTDILAVSAAFKKQQEKLNKLKEEAAEGWRVYDKYYGKKKPEPGQG